MRKIVLLLGFAFFANFVNAVEIEQLNSKILKKGLYANQIESPTVNILLTFRGGSLYEGPYADGTANLVASLLDKGTKTESAKQISEKLERLASTIEIDSGRSSFVIGIRTLEKNTEETLAVLQDVLLNATFPERETKIAKESIYQAIKQQKENPGYIANYKAKKAFYGKGLRKTYVSVLGTKKSVQSITTKQMQEFVKDRLTLNNMNVSIVGSMSNKKVSALLDKYLSKMPEGSQVAVPDVKVDYIPTELKVEKRLPQTVVMLYKEGISINNPNYYQSVLFNYMLGGGGFSSRLMEEIREKRGLTYGVKSSFDYESKIPSLFRISLQTANRNAYLTEKLIKIELAKVVKGGFTEEELKNAKSFLIGSFPINIRTSSKLLSYMDMMQQFDFPLDYLNQWPQKIAKITLKQVNDFACEFLTQKGIFSRVFVGGAE